MEVCTIIPCLRKLLSEQQIANMIRSTARPAPERQRDIQHWVCLFTLEISISCIEIYLCIQVLGIGYALFIVYY